MKIGTARAEEAKIKDNLAGYHSFHEENGETYGRFEVFWHEPDLTSEYDCCFWGKPGWYWWSCFEGCLPDSDPTGPFSSSLDALCDADEYHPDYSEVE
jgi:hypothetical protein